MSDRWRSEDASPDFFLIAGELSGDLIGAAAMRELSVRADGARFRGVGGPHMRDAGLDSLFPMEELSLLGIDEIVINWPNVRRRLKQVERAIRTDPPTALVTIDCPVFSLRVAQRVADLGIPLIHYVAPTVWIYQKGRARQIARFLDHLLLLFPFEQPYFDAVGLPSTYVGPWILEAPLETRGADTFRRRHDIPDDAPLLSLLPGSRPSVVERVLPVIDDVIAILARERPDLRLVVPTVPQVAGPVRDAARQWPLPAVVVENGGERHDAMACSTAALANSGSVTLDLALLGVPSVTIVKFAPLTTAYYRLAATIDYISLPNFILDRPAIAEFYFGNCRPDLIADALLELLGDPLAREQQKADLAEAVERLRGDGRRPSVRAADAILETIERHGKTKGVKDER